MLCLRFGACLALVGLVFCGPGYAAGETKADFYEVRTGDIQVASDGSSIETVHSELHARNDAEVLEASRVVLPFNASMQQIEVVEAYTRQGDGNKIPIDPTTIFEQLSRDAGQYSIFADLRVKVLLFPQFGVGDTAVYTVRIKTPRPYFENEYFYADVQPRAGHARDVRQTITAPMPLRVETHDVEFAKRAERGNTVYEWHFVQTEDKPAPTPLLALQIGKQPRYFASSFKSYSEIGRAYAKGSQPKMAVTAKVKAQVEEITAGETDRREQARKIYEWVSKHIRYVAIALGRGSYVPHDADSILANGYGDCKDHDVILQALLKAKGIAANSILIGAGPNGYKLTDTPIFVELNHVITYLPEFNVYLDSSLAIAPFGVLMPAEYGKQVVRISATSAELSSTPVMPPLLSSLTITTRERLDSAGLITGTITKTSAGPGSIPLRKEGMNFESVGAEKTASLQLGLHGLKDAKGKFTQDSPRSMAPTYSTTLEFTAPGWSDWLTGATRKRLPGSENSITPAGIPSSFLSMMLTGSKTEPVPCFGEHIVEDVSLELPVGTRAPPLPADARIETANIHFAAHWSAASGTITLHREFTSTFDQPQCEGAQRQQLETTMKQINESYHVEFRLNDSTPAASSATTVAAASPADSGDFAAMNRATQAFRDGNLKTVESVVSDLLSSGHALTEQMIVSARMMRGISYMRDGQLALAIDDFNECIRLKPDGDIAPYAARASAYIRMGKSRLALADMDMLIKRSPDDVHLRQMHADAALQAGDYDAAVADYNVLVKAKPDDKLLLLNRAEARFNAGMYEEAASDYERAGRLGAPDITVLNGTCTALSRSEQLGDALYQCSRALQISENAGPQLEARGYVYFRQGKLAQALADFDKAARTFPQNARYLYERGVVKTKMGDATGGQKDIAKAKEMSPEVERKVPKKMVA